MRGPGADAESELLHKVAKALVRCRPRKQGRMEEKAPPPFIVRMGEVTPGQNKGEGKKEEQRQQQQSRQQQQGKKRELVSDDITARPRNPRPGSAL